MRKRIGLIGIVSLMCFMGGCYPFTNDIGWKKASVEAHYKGIQENFYVFQISYQNKGFTNIILESEDGNFLDVQILDEKNGNEVVYTTIGKQPDKKPVKKMVLKGKRVSFEIKVNKKDVKAGEYNIDLLLEEKNREHIGVSLQNVKLH